MTSCQMCGAALVVCNANQLYCRACATARKKERDAACRERRRAARREEPDDSRISPRRKIKSIPEIVALARAAGMSYGKYVALYGGGKA